MNWDIESIKMDIAERLTNLSCKTQEELIADIIELRSAIYPISTVLSYLVDKEPHSIFASSDLFPCVEWDSYPQIQDLPDDFVVLNMSASHNEYFDNGGAIDIQNIKHLLKVLGMLEHGPKGAQTE